MPSPFQDPDDRYETFVKLYTRHEPALRAFVRSLVSSWADADEILQNTALVLWRKFGDFDVTTNFMAWACTVARFEVLGWRRDRARDRHVFDEDLIELLASEAVAQQESLASERSALEFCLGRLPDESRALVLAAYEPGAKLHEAATRLGKSATAFYKTLARIRASLLDCIRERRLAEEGGAR